MRLAFGNGIRTDTWAEFLERFGNIQICECYGATEANIGFINYVGKIGALGRENFLHKVRNLNNLLMSSANLLVKLNSYKYFGGV